MPDVTYDPLINAIHNGIKRGIRVALENGCLGSAVILIYSGMDTMAYIGMPAVQQDVNRTDFVNWAGQYIKFPCDEQLTGMDLYGARCAMLHNYSVTSRLSHAGECREILYMDRSVPEVRFAPDVSSGIVMVSIHALADAFFAGIDKYLIDVFSDKQRSLVAEQRLQSLVQVIPFDRGR